MTVNKSTSIENIHLTSRSFNFSDSSGLHYRLTYESVGGWRLRIGRSGRFGELGAAQELAHFMGENIPFGSCKIS